MRNTRIFVVEDDAATAACLKRFLEISHYDVEVAVDVDSALQLAPTIEFDVLVSDLSLPDGTGWELMENLCRQAPVRGIAFSALGEPHHLARSKAAGFREHVVKGTAANVLIAAIERVVGIAA